MEARTEAKAVEELTLTGLLSTAYSIGFHIPLTRPFIHQSLVKCITETFSQSFHFLVVSQACVKLAKI